MGLQWLHPTQDMYLCEDEEPANFDNDSVCCACQNSPSWRYCDLGILVPCLLWEGLLVLVDVLICFCLLPSRNGVPVQADGHRVHQSPDGTLLIHNSQSRDEGSYTCSAYRGSQAVSRSTEVKVLTPGERGLPMVWKRCTLHGMEEGTE